MAAKDRRIGAGGKSTLELFRLITTLALLANDKGELETMMLYYVGLSVGCSSGLLVALAVQAYLWSRFKAY
jgi:cobalamin synthase